MAAAGEQMAREAEAPVNRGLEGVVAAETAISLVDGTAGRLGYRGYDIDRLVNEGSFEEVLALLWDGALPVEDKGAAFRRALGTARVPNDAEWALLRALPLGGAPIDAVRTYVSGLAALDEQEESMAPENVRRIGVRLAGLMATGLAAWLRRRQGLPVVEPDPTLTHAADILRMVHGQPASETAVRGLDAYLITLAEHSLNASTFAARVTISTGSDTYAAITAAVAALKGALHGGANQKTMEMLLEIGSVERAESFIEESIASKRLMMGMGHRIYKTRDPRVAELERFSAALARESGDTRWHALAGRIEEITRQNPYFVQRRLYPNVEFFTAPLLYALGLPPDAQPAMFSVSRIGGWIAHVQEQLVGNRIIRPAARYVGPPLS